MTDGTPIYAGARIVGSVAGDTFHKRVKGSIHQLRRPRGWALDAQSLTDAEAAGATKVAIHDLETGATYEASIDHIRRDGFVISRGFGRQIALPLERWSVTRLGDPVQLSLFEVA